MLLMDQRRLREGWVFLGSPRGSENGPAYEQEGPIRQAARLLQVLLARGERQAQAAEVEPSMPRATRSAFHGTRRPMQMGEAGARKK